MSEAREHPCNSGEQPGARVGCSPQQQSKSTSLLTTISLMLRFKDPTHRERGAWVQEQAGRFSVQHSTAADQHHVLLVFIGSRYSSKLEDVVGGGGDAPTAVISWRWGWLPIWWSYNVWVFKAGTFDLESDGGVVNLFWESPMFARRDKSITFHRLQ